MSKPKENRKLCGAQRKHGGKCQNPAGLKTDHQGYGHCFLHWGNSDTGIVAAGREEAKEQLNTFGRDVEIEPHEAILLCIRIVAGEVEYATEQIGRLEESEILVHREEVLERPLKEEKGEENPGILVKEVKRAELRLNAWIQIKQEGMDRLVRYSATALRAGLEERLVKIAEIQGRMLASAVQGILEDLGVASHPEAPRIVAKHLRQIAQTAAS